MNATTCLNLEIQADLLEYLCPIRLMELLDLPQPLSRLPFGPARRTLLLDLRNKGLLPPLTASVPADCEWLLAPYTHLRQLALAASAYVAAPLLRRSINPKFIIPWYNILNSRLYKEAINRKDWVLINSTEPPTLTLHKEASINALTRWGASFLVALLPADRGDLLARLNLRLPLSLHNPLPPLSNVQTQALDVWVKEQHKLINTEN